MAEEEETVEAAAAAQAEPAETPAPEPQEAAPAQPEAAQPEQAPAEEPQTVGGDPEQQAAPEDKTPLDKALDALQSGGEDVEVQKVGDTVGAKEPEPVKRQEPSEPQAQQPVQSEDQLLESVSNPRARGRLQQMIYERRQAIDASQRFLSAVEGAGYDEETFDKVLQFGRLLSSDDREDQVAALKMIDQVRENIAHQIGEDGEPGIDILDSMPELKDKVENLEMTRDAAVELYRARLAEQAKQRQAEQARAEQIQQAQFAANIETGKQSITQALAAHKGDPDFRQRIAATRAWMNNPANRQAVVSQPPAAWGSLIGLVYENSLPRTPSGHPIMGRGIARGSRAVDQNLSPADRLDAAIDQLGI